MIQRILVATDRSDTASRAVAWAAEMSDKYAAIGNAFGPGRRPEDRRTSAAAKILPEDLPWWARVFQ